ncbi:MAG: hypothetical protein H7335_20795 [Massilia sp.]|nr:hypothetical protein [Massilia sp.]
MLLVALAFERAQPPVAPAPIPAPAASAASPPGAAAPRTGRVPIQRRAVQQVIVPTPRIGPEAYGPTLVPRAPGAAAAPSAAPLALPLPTSHCDAGGCLDTRGARYNGGVGNTLIGPQGRLGIKGVVKAQCF